MGCPIRKSADQSFFAAPRGLSQRSTSFIASQRQGIHRMPLRHLIALIINAHSHSAWRPRRQERRRDRALIRKTSLLRDRPDVPCGQARDDIAPRRVSATMLEIARRARLSSRPTLGAISSSRCQKTRAPPSARREHMNFRTSHPTGGARRDRTDDLLLAKQALSQLSYGPAARNACQSRVAARAQRGGGPGKI